MTNEELGNGLQTTRGLDAVTGLINSIRTVKSPSAPVQNLTYAWDKVGNLKQRRDVQQNLTEEFYYDSLNRLDCSTLNVAPQANCAALSGQMNLDVAYNQLGNITSKTGLGTYTYHATKKHQVISTSEFFYTAERDRWKQVARYGGTPETTIYIGGLVEKVTLGSVNPVTSWRHYIAGGSGPVAVYTRKSAGGDELHYLTRDHLGSVDSITTSTGVVETRLSYGAFGNRRDAATWSANPTAGTWAEITDGTRRGFTSHEMLDNLNLTHMNGRVYDQISGRFISADPFVPNPQLTQSFNRYSYVYNNPLSYTDPSGFLPSPDDPSPDYCNGICVNININFDFYSGQDLWYLRMVGGEPVPLISLRGGPTVVAVKELERDIVGGPARTASTAQSTKNSTVSRFGNDGLMSPIYLPAGTVAMSQHLFIYQQCAMMGCHGSAVLPFTRSTMTRAEEEQLNHLALTIMTMPIGSALNLVKGASLVTRAGQIHGALDPIAQAQRTTAVLRTNGATIVAGGARDLTPAQRAMLTVGEIAGRMPGAHAEVTALGTAGRLGLSPLDLAVTRAICPQCAAAIEASGGTLTSETTATWMLR